MSSKAVPGGIPPSGITVGRVVDEPARLADPALRGRGRLAHGRNSSLRRVQVDRPGPGEELNTSGTVAEPRQAATVIVLRGGEDALEVLLVQRTPQARFMGGVWVFPGGAVDTAEGEGDAAHRLAAVRELQEEAAITVDDPARARPLLALDHAGPGGDPLRHPLLPRRAPGRPGAAGGRQRVRRPALALTPGRARGLRPRGAARSSSRRSSTWSSSPRSARRPSSWPTRAAATSSRSSRAW